jgi:hypothetical protein
MAGASWISSSFWADGRTLIPVRFEDDAAERLESLLEGEACLRLRELMSKLEFELADRYGVLLPQMSAGGL